MLNPVPVPLAVRSPYFSCWDLLDFAGGIPNTSVYTTSLSNSFQHRPDWDPSLESFDLVVYVRVDNNTFRFLRDGFDPTSTDVNLTNVTISPTKTMLTAEAGHMQFNLSFLNPIEPKDWVKQSIPLSYLSLTAKSLDGAAHSVQVYSDLSAEWVSGNRSQEIFWVGIDDDSVIGYRVKRQNPTLSERATAVTKWGTLYHFMEMGDNITLKVAENSVSRDLFLQNGMLNATDAGSSPLLIPNSTVFAMSRDLGTIQATQDPIVWAVGYATDPVINYTDLSGTPPQQRSPFYKTRYSDDESLVVDFISDFANASSRAQRLDQKILQDAASFSGPLGDLVSLTTAEVYGNTQLTVATDGSGEFNKSDVMAFMRSMDTNRVNPVETLYSAFPAFMYIDPDLGGLLLEPLFRLQASPKYTNLYAAPDLETSYPDVTVSISVNNRGVEDSGNMLIMTYAHARASGDVSLISRYYDLLNSWAGYLSNSTLLIHDQYSADGFSTDNQTNLAIKGIIAIKAMSQMCSFVNKTTDFEKYSSTSSRLYAQWKGLALAGDKHLLAAYGQIGSWTLGYNLFADVWLNTSVVESSVSVC
ncbi:hypothetical protein EDB87DRAFT_1554011 [Lactarius vividus]|nr:hypothetical protein EDB87DRAFT_1554011 [Lactarius vividus]